MSTTTTDSAPARSRTRFQPSRLAGIAFVGAFIATSALLVLGTPSIYGTTEEEYVAWYADHGMNVVGVAAFIAAPLTGLLLVWVAAHLRSALVAAGGSTTAGTVGVLGAAVMAAGLTIGAAAAESGVAVGLGTDLVAADPLAAVSLLHFADAAVFTTQWGGAALVLATAIGARGTGLLPGWLLWVGAVITPLLVLSWIFAMVPTMVFVVWIATVAFLVKTGR
jgi:hypothetical protein